MFSGFPSDVLRLLCLSAAFYLVELLWTTTHCCSCSFSLQAACMLLSGTYRNCSRAVIKKLEIFLPLKEGMTEKVWKPLHQSNKLDFGGRSCLGTVVRPKRWCTLVWIKMVPPNAEFLSLSLHQPFLFTYPFVLFVKNAKHVNNYWEAGLR